MNSAHEALVLHLLPRSIPAWWAKPSYELCCTSTALKYGAVQTQRRCWTQKKKRNFDEINVY